jgi:hypothetical protein
MKNTQRQAVGQAILLGVDKLDPVHYGDFQPKLLSPNKDVADLAMIAKLAGLNVQTFVNEEATKPKMANALVKTAKSLKEGDFLLLTFAGYGGLTPNFDGHRTNSHSTTWCLHNSQLLQAELFQMLASIAEGVNILVISDTSTSAPCWRLETSSSLPDSTARTLPNEVATSVYLRNKDYYDAAHLLTDTKTQLAASLVWVSASHPNQKALENEQNGFLTAAIKHVWNGGGFSGTLDFFLEQVTMVLPPVQSPKISGHGSSPEKILNRKPFAI